MATKTTTKKTSAPKSISNSQFAANYTANKAKSPSPSSGSGSSSSGLVAAKNGVIANSDYAANIAKLRSGAVTNGTASSINAEDLGRSRFDPSQLQNGTDQFDPAAASKAFVSSINPDKLVAQHTQAQDEVATLETDLAQKQRILERAGKFDLAGELPKLQKQYGVQSKMDTVAAETLKLTQLQNKFAALNQTAENKAIPQPFIIGEQNQIEKTAAIEVGAQAAVVAAAQGNLDLANHYVDQALDLEYKDNQAKYDAAKFNYSLTYDKLTNAQQKVADERKEALELYKQDRDQFIDLKGQLMKNALANGAPGSVVQAIGNSTNYDNATSAAGEWGADTASLLDQKYKQAQIDNIYADNADKKKAKSIFSNDDVQTLLGADFSQGDIDNIEADITEYGIESVLAGLESDSQKKALRKVMGGAEEQFLDKAYFKNIFTTAQLKEAAQVAGYDGGFFGKTDVDGYLTYLETLVTQYRSAGYSDKEILKMMQ